MKKLLKLFEPRDIKTLEAYLLHFQQIPNYKKVLSSMIKFSEMYPPLSRRSMHTDIAGRLEGINEYRRLKRSEIYMNRRDIIATYDKKGGRRLMVTGRGKKVFYSDFPLAELREKKWDGFWTVVMYDFAEIERTRRRYLRRKLISFGFGSPQISILVSPLPIHEEIRELIEDEGMEREVWVTRAKRILGMENCEVAEAAWPLEEINYFYKKLEKIFPKAKGADLLGEWAQVFLAVNAQDPYLPEGLLPRDWKEKKCRKLFFSTGEAGFLQALFSAVP